MLSTLVVLAAGIALPFVVGLPLAWLLAGCKTLTRDDWIAAPFLGVAGIVVPLLNLVYLDVPVRRSAPWLWLVVLALYAFWLFRRGLVASLRAAPSRLLLASLLAYLAQAGGLIYQGADEYLGRARGDQFNYNSLAQFLADRPHSTSLGDEPRQPWTYPALVFKDDRLGQSVAQAFLLVSTGQDAAAVYFPLAALGAALLVLALAPLAETIGLPERIAAAAALGAALLPGVTQITLEYLSHALALPLLYFLVVCLQNLLRNPGLGSVSRCALVLACAAGVYPEFLPIYAGTLAVWGCCTVASRRSNGRQVLLTVVAVAALPLLLPLAMGSFVKPFSRLENAQDAEFYSRLLPQLPLIAWRSEIMPYLPHGRVWLAVARLLCLVGVAGVLSAAFRAWRAGGQGRAGFAPAVALLAIATLPVAAWLVDPSRSYHVTKLALTACPVTVLGLAWLACWRTPRLGSVVAIGLILFPAWDTLLTHREVVLNQFPGRSDSVLCRDEIGRPARRLLAGPESAPWILSLGHGTQDTRRTAWLSWYGRNQRLWLVPAKLHGMPVDDHKPGLYGDLETAPDEVNYLTGGRSGIEVVSPGDADRQQDEGLTWWRLHRGRWALPLSLRDGQAQHLALKGRPQPAGEPWGLEVYAHCEGEVRVRVCWASDEACQAKLCVVANEVGTWHVVSPGQMTLPVRLPKGRSTIYFTLLAQSPSDPPLRGAFPIGDVGFEFVPGT